MLAILEDWVESETGFVRKDALISRLKKEGKFEGWGMGEQKTYRDMVDSMSPNSFQNKALGQFVDGIIPNSAHNYRVNRNEDAFPDEMFFTPLERPQRQRVYGPAESRRRRSANKEHERRYNISIGRTPLDEECVGGIDVGGGNSDMGICINGSGSGHGIRISGSGSNGSGVVSYNDVTNGTGFNFINTGGDSANEASPAYNPVDLLHGFNPQPLPGGDDD